MIGLRIREEREQLGFTQNAMAEAIGVSKRTFIDWEKDRTSPTAVQLSALSDIGVDILYIVTGVRSVIRNNTPVISPKEREILDIIQDMRPEDRESFLKVGAALSQQKPSKDAG